MCLPQDAGAATGHETHYIPDCAGRAEITGAVVARVMADGALVLAGGRTVLLEGIRLPAAGVAALERLARAGPVTFAVTPPKTDRYGRIRAQAFGRLWFQMTLLEQGLAQVAITPDRNECAPDLYEAEARARARRAGLWAQYRIRAPGEMRGTVGSFQLVEGLVANIRRTDGRIILDFDGKGRPAFSGVIGSQDRRAFRDFAFDELIGRSIRLRGIVQDDHGRPVIALSNPAQIEVLG